MKSMLLTLMLAVAVFQTMAVADETTTRESSNKKATQHDLASHVTINRDGFGVAHVLGETDEATLFGSGYAQCEDYFWQLEDNVIRGLGRYAEVHGESELRNDLLNRAFEIPRRSEEDFDKWTGEHKRLIRAFTDGINFYLATHPNVKPRLITKFEPWHILAMDRHVIADFAYGRTHVSRPVGKVVQAERKIRSDTASAPRTIYEVLNQPRSDFQQQIDAAVGSNQWAVGPSKTKSGKAMLFINPHQPWYGWGQFHEFHLHSDETIRFSGAGFVGSPVPTIGHNDHLGWTYTVNDPDIADAWNLTFDHPSDPLQYRFNGGYRTARVWQDTIRVGDGADTETRTYEFRASHFGPIVQRVDDQTYQTVRVAKVFDMQRGQQAFNMIRAQTFEQWKDAASHCAIPMFNIAYADTAGNIFYIYNGAIPKRDPQFDWTQPVDGSDPRTDWNGYHAFHELPQVLNPLSGYVQNCNSTPYTTTDFGNPSRNDFPAYIAEDRDDDKRRAQRSRMILSAARELDFEQFQRLAYDVTLYWPMTEIPRFQREWHLLNAKDPDVAQRVKPLLDHLSDWDFRATVESTQTALCLAWYEELYGLGYPAETLKPIYQADRLECFDALLTAAASLERLHGDWRVKWGDVHRLQRVNNKANVVQAALALSRFRSSHAMPGAPGPLGVVFTVYATPSIRFARPQRYSVVGTCYMAALEFGERIRTVSITPFGVNSDPESPHYSDQSELFSQRKFKTAWYYKDDVRQHSNKSYHPGSPPRAAVPN